MHAMRAIMHPARLFHTVIGQALPPQCYSCPDGSADPDMCHGYCHVSKAAQNAARTHGGTCSNIAPRAVQEWSDVVDCTRNPITSFDNVAKTFNLLELLLNISHRVTAFSFALPQGMGVGMYLVRFVPGAQHENFSHGKWGKDLRKDRQILTKIPRCSVGRHDSLDFLVQCSQQQVTFVGLQRHEPNGDFIAFGVERSGVMVTIDGGMTRELRDSEYHAGHASYLRRGYAEPHTWFTSVGAGAGSSSPTGAGASVKSPLSIVRTIMNDLHPPAKRARTSTQVATNASRVPSGMPTSSTAQSSWCRVSVCETSRQFSLMDIVFL